MSNDSSKYTFKSPAATFDNGNTSYSYTISTSHTPQLISFQSSGNTIQKASTPTLTSKGYTLQSPSRPKPLTKHAKSASTIVQHKHLKNNSLQPMKSTSPHQRSVSSNDGIQSLSMEYDPNTGSYGYSVTTTYSTIPTYASEHSSTALGISHSPSTSYMHVAPVPMYHTPSVAYLNDKKSNSNTNNANDSKKSRIPKQKPRPKAPISRSLPPTPMHSKKSRSFTHRNDITQAKTLKKRGFAAKNSPNNTNKNMSNKRLSANNIHLTRLADCLDIDDDGDVYSNPQKIMRSRTLNDEISNVTDERQYTMNTNPLSKSQNNSRASSVHSSTDKSLENEMENSFEMDVNTPNIRPKKPLIKQSKSLNDRYSTNEEAKEPEMEEKKQENEDWQIMGDILFSLKHSLVSRMYGLDNKDESDDKSNKKKGKKKKKNVKPHLHTKQNEWQTFHFEEYASQLFSELRAKWLECDILSGKYVRALFGEKNTNVSVQELDINKSCKYYWRRLNTNSKSGQIFFQTINGEYIIKSMPKSEAEFFRKSFLAQYYSYMLSQPDSLLMHIMGCYNIRYKKEKVNKSNMNLSSNNEYNSKRKQDVNKGVYVIIMKSILFCEMTPTVKMHKIYDLKGSTHNRTASRYKLELDKISFAALNEIDDNSFEQDIESVTNINDNIKLISSSYSCGFYQPTKNENKSKFKTDQKNKHKSGAITVYKRSKVLKDLDFMHDNEKIIVGDNTHKIKTTYLAQLRTDLDFLISMNVMDYSLLVGIHRLNLENKRKHRRQHSHSKPKRIKEGNLFTFEFGGMCAEKIMFDSKKKSNRLKKKNIYFTGIIDFLQKYNTKKKMESYYKRVKVSEGKDAISSVDSKTYANRLYDFIDQRIQ